MRRLALLLLLGMAAAACNSAPATDPQRSADGALIDGSVEAFHDRLESLRGTPVVVNFWATWCVPCRTEMPRLVEAAHTYEGRVAFLGVDVEDDRTAAERFIDDFAIPFDSLYDERGQIRRDQRVLGLPVTQFYLADGELAFVHHGEITEEDLLEKIEEVLRASR